jgi:GTP-binding protein LepA
MPTPTSNIRNFCIIAHIDHGKSTLADQFLLKTGTISERDMRAQTLDSMDLERERGITIRMHPVTCYYQYGGQKYELNLIDTPGHVDFNYEVSRSLAACEGAVLLVDAFQGVQAQTVANAFLAMDANLKLIPTLNKIDLPHARPDFVVGEMETAVMTVPEEVMKVSAKAGLGIEELLGAIIDRVPPPTGDLAAPTKALVYNSHFDSYKGVVAYVRVMDGEIKPAMRIRMMRANREYVVTEVGQFRPGMEKCDSLGAGQAGYFMANVKTIGDVNIGDTVTDAFNPTAEPLAGYKEPKPMVYSGLYPVSNGDFEDLREALGKLKLNDTAPNVTFEIEKTNGEIIQVYGPQDVPDGGGIKEFREPICRISFLIPAANIGDIMGMCNDRRGTYVRTDYLSQQRVIIVYEMPLGEVIYDLYDKLKSVTHGYGTMDYEVTGYRAADLIRLDILVHGQKVDALSIVVHRSVADRRGRQVLTKLRKEISRHMFEVALQAAIGGKIIARETIAAMRKNVTAKCYGGDISRKRKLWDKQAEGKKRMKAIGQVEVPQEAFLAVLEDD